MNEKKVIKDLKERNEKLSQQYDFNRVHLITLENKNYRLEQQLQTYKDKEDKVEHFVKTQKEIVIKQPSYDEETDQYFISKFDDILKILNEGKNNE